ncbi:putative RNA-directed DNA polymerase [Helianthus annuus]|nr:putative RNA-directed DNA polymerase [Helianthus annuus]KAJ0563040.1 putative RNA-directed DNA polymerase [Helianthus annuus]KAJ0728410.1 putative RNA-directed DNA polymerase [Helianthus annuus]KAJ0731168.1 putative RNA-directed DNA polymerase [Helianthus annuus]
MAGEDKTDNPPPPSDKLTKPLHPAYSPPNPPAVPQPPVHPPPSHPMATRSKTGSLKPPLYNLTTTHLSPVPKTYHQAFTDPNWLRAMQAEYTALQENETWDLVPRPADRPVIRCMWLFRHKFKSDGSLERYKARLVVNGKSQTVGIDCADTFSPVVKPATIRTVLSLAVSKSWPIHQLDVKNAFLHGHLNETVFMHQPPGFVDKRFPGFVCRLKKSLYGLKQAPRAWYTRFANYILSHGFKSSACDNSLFIYSSGQEIAYLLLYVDDIVLTASSDKLLHDIIQTLSREFAMSDLGTLHHFLGIRVTRQANGLFLDQTQYAKDIIARANMTSCKPCATPVDLSSKLSATDGPLFHDPTLYRSLAGALQYLTFTRPDLSYAVQQICLFMHEPHDPHYAFMKRILRYIQGTLDYGIRMTRSNTQSLVAYSDADWGGCPDSRRSTSGYCVFLGNNLLSWSSKRQPTVSRSSAEAEYRGVANAVAEVTWLRNLLLELHVPLLQASVVFCDNVSAVYLSDNPVQHQRTKHIEIDIHFVREKVRLGHVRVSHVPAPFQYADIFTKGLSRQLFQSFRSSLTVCPRIVQTAGEY